MVDQHPQPPPPDLLESVSKRAAYDAKALSDSFFWKLFALAAAFLGAALGWKFLATGDERIDQAIGAAIGLSIETVVGYLLMLGFAGLGQRDTLREHVRELRREIEALNRRAPDPGELHRWFIRDCDIVLERLALDPDGQRATAESIDREEQEITRIITEYIKWGEKQNRLNTLGHGLRPLQRPSGDTRKPGERRPQEERVVLVGVVNNMRYEVKPDMMRLSGGADGSVETGV